MATNGSGQISAQQLVDILPNAFAIVDHCDRALFANRLFKEMQTTDTETTLDSWASSIHAEDYNRVVSGYREALKSKHRIRSEYRIVGEGDPWRVLLLTPLSRDSLQQCGLGDGLGFMCTIVDITVEKAAELAQKKSAQRAREHKKQQEKFIDMISHEVRNPLSAVLHCTEEILDAMHHTVDPDTAKRRIVEAAETISLCVGHQKKIIDDVMMLSKLDACMLMLTPQPVQPTRHLGRSLTMFQPELRKHNIKFELKVDHSYVECGIDCVMADMDRMAQVLINLMSNAIKYTAEAPHERSIRVSMAASVRRPPSYPPNIVFFKSDEKALRMDETSRPEWGSGPVSYVMVAVKDSGIGIDDQHQTRLFERFKQATPRTDRIYGGFGLGLNVSRTLCHLHGGEIGVSSKEGCGSTFGFFFTVRKCPGEACVTPARTRTPIDTLRHEIHDMGNEITGVNERTDTPDVPEYPPVSHVPEVAHNAPSDERKEHTQALAHKVHTKADPEGDHSGTDRRSDRTSDGTSKPRVLLVEDNIINQKIMSRKLKCSGFDVTETSNGQEALDAYRQETFDCILMDQQMPVMDGSTAARAIRAWEKGTATRVPILGVTANVREEQQVEMLEAGMDSIIHKPYKMQDLCDMVKQLVIKENPD